MEKDDNLTQNRVAFIDTTRAAAIFMVLIVHACEFFYIGTRQFTDSEIFWAGFIDSALRVSVPIFVMISAYLLVPTKERMELFYKNRLPKILTPFLFWSIIYATLPALWGAFATEEIATRLLRIPYMFNDGHLWYIYMFVGVVLFIPIISAWLKSATKREVQIFIAIWFVASFHHYLKYFADTNEWISIFGECKWNEFSTFWNFSGYIGYVVLAYYIRQFIDWSRAKSLTIGSICFVAGWIVGYLWFNNFYSSGDLYLYEIAWRFCAPNVILASFGLFVIMKSVGGHFNNIIIREVAKASYGIYLSHILVLNFINAHLSFIESTPLKIGVYSILCLIGSYCIVKVLSLLPKGKYLRIV